MIAAQSWYTYTATEEKKTTQAWEMEKNGNILYIRYTRFCYEFKFNIGTIPIEWEQKKTSWKKSIVSNILRCIEANGKWLLRLGVSGKEGERKRAE